MSTHTQSGHRFCPGCGQSLPLHKFWSLRVNGRRHRTAVCRECQQEAEDWPTESPWMRAEREVERRYGVPSRFWLNSHSPLSLLHTVLAIEYAVAEGAVIPHELTVSDAELLCRLVGFQRVDTVNHTAGCPAPQGARLHQGESDGVQHGTTEDHAAA